MKLYMAPLEGITGYIYRNAHHEVYASMDKYFAPFIVPTAEGTMRKREQRDVMPENNRGLPLVPQVLTGNADAFLEVVRELEQLGYREVNLNLGCPSGTVVPKGKGAGALAEPDRLQRLLEEIFRRSPLPVSVKSRLGIEEPEEFGRICEIYNDYPLEELILHSRVLKDYYKNKPHLDAFGDACRMSRHRIIYNGNLFTVRDVRMIEDRFPQIDGVMLGRGLIADPGLADRVLGEAPGLDAFRQFHDLVYEDHKKTQSGDRNLMFRMKELWFYMIHGFADSEGAVRKLRKIQKAGEYEAWFRDVIRTCSYKPEEGFHP